MGFTGVVMVSPRRNKWSCSRVHPISRVFFIPSFLGEVIINTIYNDHTGFFKHPRIRPPKAFSPATRIVNEAFFLPRQFFAKVWGVQQPSASFGDHQITRSLVWQSTKSSNGSKGRRLQQGPGQDLAQAFWRSMSPLFQRK